MGMSDTVRESLSLFRSGVKPEEIAERRNLVPGTIYGHLATAVENGEPLRMEDFFSAEDERLMSTALEKASGILSAAKEFLGGRFDYGPLRLYCALRGKGARG